MMQEENESENKDCEDLRKDNGRKDLEDNEDEGRKFRR